MNIELKKIKIKDLFNGYKDNNENGVVGYDGKLDIRPSYQREFVYKDKQRDEVINTVRKGFPLNIMYWVKKNGTIDEYEVLDGQQRTISICQYLNGDYSINFQFYHNLTQQEKDEILNYELMVYHCEGNDREKLEWFKTINIAGEKLTEQELRNAIYTGVWLNESKKYFSKNNCAAYNNANKYLKGSPIRQEYLEKVLFWISDKDKETIEDYMAKHQNENNANELIRYFNSVIDWTKMTFTNYRKEMKDVQWGLLYNKFEKEKLDPISLENEIIRLMKDEDVTKKSGIYEYLLTKKEKFLNLRAFTDDQKREVFEKQNGICLVCKKTFKIEEMEGDHVVPWSKGGKTILSNLEMLCKDCNRSKSDN